MEEETEKKNEKGILIPVCASLSHGTFLPCNFIFEINVLLEARAF